jgi:hypothetical protein
MAFYSDSGAFSPFFRPQMPDGCVTSLVAFGASIKCPRRVAMANLPSS